MVRRFGEREFVRDQWAHRTYREFQADVLRAAKGLHAIGVRRGDKVSLLMGNQLEWLVVQFAVVSLGAVLVPINTWWKRRELEHALTISDTTTLVMVDRYLNNDYVALLTEFGDLATAFPRLRRVVHFGTVFSQGGLSWEQVLAAGADVADQVILDLARSVTPDDHGMYMFTSGSTSRSKLAQLHHHGIIANPHSIGARMHLTEQDRVLIPVSMFWAYASVNALFAAMSHGAAVIIQFSFSAEETLQLIETERCTAVYTLPNILIALHAHPERARYDLSSWRTGICRSQFLHLAEEMGVPHAITSYGLTEGYGNSCTSDASWPSALRRQGAGKPLPGTEMEIVDPVTHARLPQGEPGEIRLRGFVTSGYYNDPERTAEAIDAEGWFYTGDLASFDADGILQFSARIKEMIKTGGINVTPADVEGALEDHPAVRQAVVVGVPDPQREEIVAAMVVLREDVSVTEADLVDHCRRTMAAFKVPRHIRIVAHDAVPLTDTGKVSKRLVQEVLTASYQSAA